MTFNADLATAKLPTATTSASIVVMLSISKVVPFELVDDLANFSRDLLDEIHVATVPRANG